MDPKIVQASGINIDGNPIFDLAKKAQLKRLSTKRAMRQARSSSFLKKVRPEHYREIVNYLFYHFYELDVQSIPDLLGKLCVACAERQEVEQRQRIAIHFGYAALLCAQGKLRKGICHIAALRDDLPEELQLAVNVALGFYRLVIDPEINLPGMSTADPPAMEDIPWDKVVQHQERDCSPSHPLAEISAALRPLFREFPGICLSFCTGQYDKLFEIVASLSRLADTTNGPTWLAPMGRLCGTTAIVCGQAGLTGSHEQNEASPVLSGYQTTDQSELTYVIDGVCDALDDWAYSLRTRNHTTIAAFISGISSAIRVEEGDSKKALREAQRAKKEFRKAGLLGLECPCDLVIGEAYHRIGSYREALNHFRLALGRLPKIPNPWLVVRCLDSIAEFFATLDALDDAKCTLSAAADLMERIRERWATDHFRSILMPDMAKRYWRIAELCAEQGNCGEALEHVERIKSRSLSEAMEEITGRSTDEEINDHLHLKQALLRLRSYGRTPPAFQSPEEAASWADHMSESRKAYQETQVHVDEKSASIARYPFRGLSLEDVRSLLPDDRTAIVDLFPTDRQTIVFVVLRDKPIEETTVLIEGYRAESLTANAEYFGTPKNVEERKRALDEVLEELYEDLFSQIEPILKKERVRTIIFLPTCSFRLLPLHAMYRLEGGKRKYLIDEYLVSYAPSAWILKCCIACEKPISTSDVFVCHADPRKIQKLFFSKLEARALGRRFRTAPHLKTTADEFLEQAAAAHILHYTGHADSEGLELHKGDDNKLMGRLTVPDLFEGLEMHHNYLTVLSACETGKIIVGPGDDYIGLTEAFLAIGASTVISSLWQVSDISTCLLMGKMYEKLDKGHGKAQSLRSAQRWLRDSSYQERLRFAETLIPWLRSAAGKESTDSHTVRRSSFSLEKLMPKDLSHPYYWAGFICTGAP